MEKWFNDGICYKNFGDTGVHKDVHFSKCTKEKCLLNCQSLYFISIISSLHLPINGKRIKTQSLGTDIFVNSLQIQSLCMYVSYKACRKSAVILLSFPSMFQKQALATSIPYHRTWLQPQPIHFWSCFLQEHPWACAVGGSNAWVPATHVGDDRWVLVSWLWSGPSLTGSEVWRMNQQMEGIPLCFCLPLSFSN